MTMKDEKEKSSASKRYQPFDRQNCRRSGPGALASQNLGNAPTDSSDTNNAIAGPSTAPEPNYIDQGLHPAIRRGDSPPPTPIFTRDEFPDDEDETPLFAQQPSPLLSASDGQLLEALADSSRAVHSLVNPLEYFVTNIVPHMRVPEEDGGGFAFDLAPEVAIAALHALIQQLNNTNRDSHSL